MKKLVITNHDSDFLCSEKELAAQIAAYADTQVDILEWCIGGSGRCTYPTQVGQFGANARAGFPTEEHQRIHEARHTAAARGHDSLRLVVEAGHAAGIEVFASFRTQSLSGLASWWAFGRYHNSRFWWQNQDKRIRHKDFAFDFRLSYAYPQVRRFFLEIFEEVLEYDVDGIHVDFCRSVPFVGYEEPVVDEFYAETGRDPFALPGSDYVWLQDLYVESEYHKHVYFEPEDRQRPASLDPGLVAPMEEGWLRFRCKYLTAFVRDLRLRLDQAAQQRGRKLRLSCRTDWRFPLEAGIDYARWAREGWLDILQLAQQGSGGWEIPISRFKEELRDTGCLVLFGETGNVKGHDLQPHEEQAMTEREKAERPSRHMTIEEYCERAVRWYEQGADGIHVFNDTFNYDLYRVLGDPQKCRQVAER